VGAIDQCSREVCGDDEVDLWGAKGDPGRDKVALRG